MTSTVNAGNTTSTFSNPVDWLFPKKQEHDAAEADTKKKEQQVGNEDHVNDMVQKEDAKPLEDSKDDVAHKESVVDLLFKETPPTDAKPSTQDSTLSKEEPLVKPETETASEAHTPAPEKPLTTEQHLDEEDHAADPVAQTPAEAPVAEQAHDHVQLSNLGGMEVDHVDLAIVSVHKKPAEHDKKPAAHAEGNADANPMPLENFWKMLSSLINFHLDNDHGAGHGSTFPVNMDHGFFHPFGLGMQQPHEQKQPGNHGNGAHHGHHFM